MTPDEIKRRAIDEAQQRIETWSEDELRCYAFDRLVDEMLGDENGHTEVVNLIEEHRRTT